MSGVREFLRPGSVSEAARMLRGSPGRVALAGGTFLGAHCPPRVTGLVDLSRLGLSYIKAQGTGVIIGAMTPLAAVADSAQCGSLARCVAEAASEPLRQMITVGGNVMIPLRWSDLPLLLHVLDGEFVVQGSGGKAREYESAEFFKQAPTTLLRRGELLTEVRVPVLRGVRLARRKLVRNHGDIPALQVAASLQVKRGKMKSVRVAFVAQKPLPARLAACEKLLEGQRADDALLTAAAEAVRGEAGTLTDVRFSSEYLLEMLGVFVRRVLEECLHE